VPILPKPIEIADLWGWLQRTCRCAADHPLPDLKDVPV
jgi:hypothetical protein